MAILAALNRIRDRLQAFRADADGQVVIIFALTLIPVLGLVGAAVDYSRGNSAKVAMQAAVDSTALMLSKDAQTMTTSQLNVKANQYFSALFHRPEVSNVVITPTFSSPSDGNFRVDITATGSVATSFTKILGQDRLDIDVKSQVVWGIKKLELALALDNTGSMDSNNKMTELKKAAISLLDTLKKAAGKVDDVKISIIPFNTGVNIGTTYRSESWIDWTEAFGTCSRSQYKTKTACTSGSGKWTASNKKNSWKGCVIDRDQPNDALDTTPTGAKATKFPATLPPEWCDDTLVSAMPLTDITTGYTTLKNKINSMDPDGNTNVTIGLAWAWHSLTSNLPLPEGQAPKPDLDKVIILLTDGENTQNRWTTNESAINARTQAACTNVKAANIKLYTVRVINGNTSLLQACATKPDMYYDVQNASQLNAVFSAIAQNLANLRIAK